MARRSSRAPKKPAKAAKPARGRKSAAPAVAEVEIVEESGGTGWEAGVAIVTSLLLVAAIVCVDMMRGWYGEGLFGG